MSKSETDQNKNLIIQNIFARKTKINTLIQYDLLQEIIEEFIKRQKEMNEKINNIEFRLDATFINENPIDIFNNNLNDKGQNIIEENINDKESPIYDKENEKEKEGGNEKGKEKEKEKKEEKEKEKEFKITISKRHRNSINSLDNQDIGEKANYKFDNLINVLSSRIDKLENINKEITKKLFSLNKDRQKEIEEIKGHSYSKLEHNEEQIKIINEKLIHIDTKLDEVNGIDIYKIPGIDINNTNNNKDTSLILIKSIEQKISKKLELIDTRTKTYDNQISEIKNEFKNNTNKTDSAIRISNSIKENYDNLANELYCNIRDFKNKYEEDNKILEENYEKKLNETKEQLIKYTNKENKKLIDLILGNVAAMNAESENNNKIDPKTFINLSNEKINNLSEELKHYFNKGISNTENYIKSFVKNVNNEIEKIKKDLNDIQKELSKKLIKSDLEPLIIKSEKIESRHIELVNDIDDFKIEIEKCNETCSKVVKMVDYLGGQIIQSYRPDLNKSKDNNELKGIDLSNYIDKNIFKNEINLIYKKIDKLLELETENNKYIQNYENKLKIYATENDLNNLEHCLMNIIEEFKITSSKTFLDKNIAQKTFKFLDLQIRNISENLLFNPNSNNNNNNLDNWLLAKKPINSYTCASCDSYIGELHNKNQYVPWNKILSKDDKKYRMGHGFSRMLQMIKTDILKNAEKVNNDLSLKIDDKKTLNNFHNNFSNTPSNGGKQLPRINSQINFHKMNIMNKTQRNIHLHFVQHDSETNNEKDKNEKENNLSNNPIIYNNKGNNTSRSRNKIEENDDNNSPKVLKIYKKIKK